MKSKYGSRMIKRPQKFIDGEIGGELTAADRNAVTVEVKFKDDEGLTKEVSFINDLKYPNNKPVRKLEDLKLGEEVLSLYHGNVMWEAVIVKTANGSGSKKSTSNVVSKSTVENRQQKKTNKDKNKDECSNHQVKGNNETEKLQRKKKELKSEENANKAATFAAKQAMAAQLFSNKKPNNIPSNASNILSATSYSDATRSQGHSVVIPDPSVADSCPGSSCSPCPNSGPSSNSGPSFSPGPGTNSIIGFKTDPGSKSGPDLKSSPSSNTNASSKFCSGMKSSFVRDTCPGFDNDPGSNSDPYAKVGHGSNLGTLLKSGHGTNSDPCAISDPCPNICPDIISCPQTSGAEPGPGIHTDPNAYPVYSAVPVSDNEPVANSCYNVNPAPISGANCTVTYPAVTSSLSSNGPLYSGQNQPNPTNFGFSSLNFGYPQPAYPMGMPFFNPSVNFHPYMSLTPINYPSTDTDNSMEQHKLQPILHEQQLNFSSSSVRHDDLSSPTMSNTVDDSNLVTQSLSLLNATNINSSSESMDVNDQVEDASKTNSCSLHDNSIMANFDCSPDPPTLHETEPNSDNADCPGCLAKDLLIKDLKHQIKVLKDSRNETSCNISAGTRKRQYIPKTRPDITFAPYILLENPKKPEIPDGYQQMAENSPIAVPVDWMQETLATISKTTDRRQKKKARKTGQFKPHDSSKETIRKLMDGFYDAAELAIPGGTKSFVNDPVFKSLKLYAVHNLNMTEPVFNECWNKKMTYYRTLLKSIEKKDRSDVRNCDIEG